MKLAILSDTHGNLVALDAVLTELKKESIEHMVCLGDVSAMGPQPHECLQRIQELNMPVVLGNTDYWLIDPSSIPADDVPIFNIMRWCATQMTGTDHAFLEKFQATVDVKLSDEKSLLCFHGSPTDFNGIIMSTSPDEEFLNHFSNRNDTLYTGGHTHVQLLRRVGEKLYLNPGSIGLPCQYYPNLHGGLSLMHRAEYAVITVEHDNMGIDLRSIPLDIDLILETAKNSKMPHVDWWQALWGKAPTKV